LSFVFGLKVFVFFPLVSLVSLLCNTWLVKKLGGLTGDTLGAVSEVLETVTLLLATVLA
jgi:cobalamin synthase